MASVANINPLGIVNLVDGYATTATAAGTTTLTASSPQQQYFTGSSTQTVRLPVTTTLVNGQQYWIVNNSTGVVSIQTGGAAAITTVPANTKNTFTCINNGSDVAASWSYTGVVASLSGVTGVLAPASGGTGIANSNANTITVGGAINTASSFTTSGANALTLTTTGATNVTLPTTGTLVNSAVATLSSLTSIGTITTGVWNGTLISPTFGGTGVNNGASTITLAANFATSGANTLTLTTTGATNVTLPTTGTLVNTAIATLSSLTSIGTITTGTWNATTIAANFGGTGNTVYAVGDLLFANTTSTLSRLADVATGQVLVSGGVGVAPAYSANPTLTGVTLSGLTASQAVVTNGSKALASLSYTSAATASTLVSRDANANTTMANLIDGFATTATAAGTTVLTVASVQQQYFTGSTTQTVRLPVTTTLVNGQKYIIVNNSTGVLTIQTGGAAAITTIPANTSNTFTCINNASDVAASWSYTGVVASLSSVTGVLLPASGGTGVANSNANTITVGGAINTASSFTTSGANALTLTTTGATNVTLPTTGTIVNTAVATLSSLTSIGTITTGVWNGTAIVAANGGTGNTVYAVGDLLFANTTSTLARLADVATGSALTSGGVGVAPLWTAFTNNATVSTLMSRDANANTRINNLISGYATTTTAAGITTLTVASAYMQFFTGSTTQTVRLPVTTTLVNGQEYVIVNNSTGVLTIQTGGAAAVTTISGNSTLTFTCINDGSDVAGSWSFTSAPASTTGTSLTLSSLTANSFLYSGTAGLLTTTAAPTNGQILVGVTGSAPASVSMSGDVTLSQTGVVNVIAVDLLPINATTGASSSIFFGYSSTVPSATQSIGIGYEALNVVSGTQNTALGVGAGLSLTTGTGNTILGYNANTGANIVNAIVIGNGAKAGLALATSTVMIGQSAGNLTATGDANIGIGTRTFQAATTINRSVAIGFDALSTATTGNGEIAVGWQALKSQNGGSNNMGIGINAGYQITTGGQNTIIGYSAGQLMTTGSGNLIVGYAAGFNAALTSSSGFNVLIGNEVGLSLGNTFRSIAIGFRALYRGTGSDNVCLGSYCLSSVSTGIRNIAIGTNSALGLTTGSGNIAIGHAAFGNNVLTIGSASKYNITGNNNIAIGNECSSFDPATSEAAITLAGSNNIALGANASRYITFNAASNIAIGTNAYSTGGGSSDSVVIGNNAVVGTVAPITTTISQSVATVTSGSALFLPEMVGGTIVYATVGNSGATGISAFVSSTVVTATTNLSIGSTSFAFVFYNLSGNTAVGTSALNAARTGRSTAVGANALNVATAGRYTVGTASQSTTTVTGSGTAWFAEMVGGTIVFSGGQTGLITAFNSVTSLTVTTSQTVGSTTYIIYLPYNGNVGVGYNVGSGVTTGHYNTLMGYGAGSTITTGFNNVCIGFGANTSATVSNSISIGRSASATVDGAIAIGAVTANVAGGFFCAHRGPLSSTVNMAGFIAGTNELVEVTSSRRYKQNIRDLEEVTDKFSLLRPVRFNAIEGHGDPKEEHIGLIAEEVEELFPEVVTHNMEGQTTGMMYDRMIALLIKEMKAMKRDYTAQIDELRSRLADREL